ESGSQGGSRRVQFRRGQAGRRNRPRCGYRLVGFVVTRWPRGFTLVELLVVLVIVALAGGLAIVTLDRDERRLAAREAKRFAGALEFAAARAQARNETLGVSADSAIRFWRREPSGEKWLPLDDDVLGARVLPEPLLATPLSYAGQRIASNTIVR